MAKKNKYVDSYQYKNYLTNCPNCGAPLKDTDYDCPYCCINLVGHNEKSNMADNLSNYADEMDEIVDKHNQLNEKIRKDNDKIQKKKELKTKMKKLTLLIIAVGLIATILFSFVMESIELMKSKNYDEVKQYLSEYSADVINVKRLDYDFYLQKESKEERDNALLKLEVGYDKSRSITILRESYQKDDDDFSVIRVITNNVASIPRTELAYGEVTYSSRYAFVDIEDFFEDFDKKIEPDEYILMNYTKESENYIEKLNTLNVEGTKVYLYYIGTKYDSDHADKIIGIVQLDSKHLYVSEISIQKAEVDSNPVLEDLEGYFYIVEE